MSRIVVAHELRFQPFISTSDIQRRVGELGARISHDYQRRRPVMLAVLNGAFVFAADLARACDIDCEISFIKLSSYQGTRSSGQVANLIGLDAKVEGRPIIIIEDIIDSGRTLYHFLPELRSLKPESVAIAALLFKPSALEFDVRIDYVGFEIPPKFVIGYGLDYDGLGRNLPAIYQLIE
jgi:hypoxanthine phosphoribosyltransferase